MTTPSASGLSLRHRLLLVTMLTSATGIVLGCLGFLAYDTHASRVRKVDGLHLTADILGTNTTAALAFDDVESGETLLSALKTRKNIRAGVIYRPDGTVFASYVRADLKGDFVIPPAGNGGAVWNKDSVTLTCPTGKALRAEIQRLADPKLHNGSDPMNKNQEAASESVWNLADLLTRVDNDRELLLDLLAIFKEDFPRIIQSLESAVTSGDLKNTASLSHTLKGMLANLGGVRAAAAASKLEGLATSGEKASLKDALESLEREAAALLPELDAYMAGVPR